MGVGLTGYRKSTEQIDLTGEVIANVPDQCHIKGNINRKGERIYHMPGQQAYSVTRINPTRGERWFCSEVEASAAGWRKALR